MLRCKVALLSTFNFLYLHILAKKERLRFLVKGFHLETHKHKKKKSLQYALPSPLEHPLGGSHLPLTAFESNISKNSGIPPGISHR
jgi:hypothetical protein